jgi:hypothetical protein
MILNPFVEAKPLAPALFGALLAAMVTGLIGLIGLFELRPPAVVDKQGALYLNLAVLWQIALTILNGDTCGVGISKLIGLTCRLDFAREAFDIVQHSNSALIHVTATLAAAGAAFVTSFALIRSKAAKGEQFVTLQGRRVLFDADARASMRTAVAKTGRLAKRDLWLTPHVQLNATAEGFNVLAVGAHGSGKSSTLRALIGQVIERGDHVLVHDVKGDMTAGLPIRQFILVAPHDRRSATYDIADDIRNRQHASEFAAHAIPTAENDRMWGEGARSVWADLVMALAVDKPHGWTWDDLRQQLLSPGLTIKQTLERHGALTSAGHLVFGSVNPEENRTTMSLLITMWVSALTTVVPLADAWRDVPQTRRFSLRRWLKADTELPRVIVLQKSSEYPALSALVGGFLIDRLVGLALRPGRKLNAGTHIEPARNDTKVAEQANQNGWPEEPRSEPKLTLCLDELPECRRLHRLPNLLNVGREFGVVTLAAVQDFVQLTELYGENLSRVILARFRIKLVHQLDTGDTAERISKLLGERRVEFLGPPRRDPRSGRLMRELVREVIPGFPVERFEAELGVRVRGDRTTIRLMVLGLGHPGVVDVPLTAWGDQRAGHVAANWLNE